MSRSPPDTKILIKLSDAKRPLAVTVQSPFHENQNALALRPSMWAKLRLNRVFGNHKRSIAQELKSR